MSNESEAIIIDSGSGVTKIGAGGYDLPQKTFPSICAKGATTDSATETSNTTQNEENMPCYCGQAAIEHILSSNVQVDSCIFPIKRGVTVDWDKLELLWKDGIEEGLRVSLEEHPCLLADTALNPKSNREKLIQLLFETFSCPAAYISLQEVLSLYASGKTSGLVVNSGSGITTVVPVYEGYALAYATAKVEFGGRDVTQLLCEQVQLPFEATELKKNVLLSAVKERLCYVSMDYTNELNQFKQHGISLETKKNNANAEQTTHQTELPDGTAITLKEEMFQIAELLFTPENHPYCAEKGHYIGLPALVYDSIMLCDLEIRKDLYKNILLSGGNTLLKNFSHRLANELIASFAPSTTEVETHEPKDRHQLAWMGGSILSSLSAFQTMWITREDFEDTGPTIVHRKCIN